MTGGHTKRFKWSVVISFPQEVKKTKSNKENLRKFVKFSEFSPKMEQNTYKTILRRRISIIFNNAQVWHNLLVLIRSNHVHQPSNVENA